ncbi:MAG: hypothetical protein LBI45_04725 [Bacteroidales bacterium]|nr:hypothetical protein [Bacteroidales bacterium]
MKLRIGSMIKREAKKKEISSKYIAEKLSSYRQNSDKIFRMDDINIEDLIRISFLLKYNFLHYIVKDYISHLSFSVTDLESSHFLVNNNNGNCEFLSQILIGEKIKEVADNNNWNKQKVAEILNCTPTIVSYLFKRKSVKVKKLLEVSDAFQYDFISNVYLSEMSI